MAGFLAQSPPPWNAGLDDVMGRSTSIKRRSRHSGVHLAPPLDPGAEETSESGDGDGEGDGEGEGEGDREVEESDVFGSEDDDGASAQSEEEDAILDDEGLDEFDGPGAGQNRRKLHSGIAVLDASLPRTDGTFPIRPLCPFRAEISRCLQLSWFSPLPTSRLPGSTDPNDQVPPFVESQQWSQPPSATASSSAASTALAPPPPTAPRRPRSRWHFGIRSRSPPMEIMLELYRTLQALGMEWRAKPERSSRGTSAGGSDGAASGSSSGAPGEGGAGGGKGAAGEETKEEREREREREEHHDDQSRGEELFFLETRWRVRNVLVSVSLLFPSSFSPFFFPFSPVIVGPTSFKGGRR